MKRQIVVTTGLKGVLTDIWVHARSNGLPTFTVRVLDDAENAPIYETAADRLSKDRLCNVRWFIGNGDSHEFDATIIRHPSAYGGGSKPWRPVHMTAPDFHSKVDEAYETMKECLDEAQP